MLPFPFNHNHFPESPGLFHRVSGFWIGTCRHWSDNSRAFSLHFVATAPPDLPFVISNNGSTYSSKKLNCGAG